MLLYFFVEVRTLFPDTVERDRRLKIEDQHYRNDPVLQSSLPKLNITINVAPLTSSSVSPLPPNNYEQ